MEKKNKTRLGAIGVMLIIACGNFTRIVRTDSIHTVEILYILAMGALSGILLVGVIKMIREKNNPSK